MEAGSNRIAGVKENIASIRTEITSESEVIEMASTVYMDEHDRCKKYSNFLPV
jgi:hypothetical protein